MTIRAPLSATLASVAVGLALAGCGDDDVGKPIPRATAQELLADLDAVQEDMDAGNCEEALAAIGDIRNDVDALDDVGVGADVQDALGDGVDTLGTLASGTRGCEGAREPETTPETTPETVPPPVTETVPPPTTETTPPPTETTPEPIPEAPPDEGDGAEQFDPDAGIPPGQQKKREDDD